ncbi:hypothetical protein [Marvinbryantia formatexigens]|nr:hypothetical protein [Marvinbryantia formatexigens]UWO23473.1 hypothetical protein NQ534_13555 [Marvinbryantia formatexigens DSM 14469]SDG57275.1 hypothetical protein SAMN05660368_02838 [Marvinbryantia formatexigens]
MKIRKRKWLLIIPGIFLICLWIHAVYRINREIPRTKSIVYQNGEWVPWKNGVEILVKGGSFMEDSQIRGNQNVTEGMRYAGEMKLLWVDIELKNTSQTGARVDCLELGAEAPGWANIPNPDFYYTINEGKNGLQTELEPGENIEYSLPFLLLKNNFRNSEWKKVEQKEYYITLALYPEKKMIAVQT